MSHADFADHQHPATSPPGRTLHNPLGYDLVVWLRTLGREQCLRERCLKLAQLRAGDAVLDVGCGTGSLAIAARRRLGAAGKVCGIDASPEMIARAGRKARRAGAEVAFGIAPAQALPFPDAHFDVVLSTLMLHHLSRQGRIDAIREMRRVCKPGGRVLVVDFGPDQARHGLLRHFHRHGHTRPDDILKLLTSAGLVRIASGPVGLHGLHFVLANAP